ncbi:hypothetical protein K2173_014909 [Erythroxylum novogranatense]|uniref:Uncharacterized protein n=1 Tax=Erythroxylum novogranatense TaxID=1862640 RepID=A0AAV8TFY1_9ROSI|nr:hypothetical protein K2173_014909 [Erythroxylum novogranatense]
METPVEKTPPTQQEPDIKRPKMSTTTSDEEPCDPTNTTKKQRYKRRKIAIFFAYCGALFHSGVVPQQDHGNPKRYDWARSARTGSGRFESWLNSFLPYQIRIFGYKRVTASYNAKKFCDRRRYVYLLPIFALDPCSHRDRESVLASLGSGKELVKCLECSKRGRKVVGAIGKRSFESKPVDISSNNGDACVTEDVIGDNLNSESIRESEGSDHDGIETKSSVLVRNGQLSVRSVKRMSWVLKVRLETTTIEKSQNISVRFFVYMKMYTWLYVCMCVFSLNYYFYFSKLTHPFDNSVQKLSKCKLFDLVFYA